MVPTGVASARLGISRSTLSRWVAQGLFQAGTHYRDGLTDRSPRRWDLEAVEARIEQLRTLPSRPLVAGQEAAASGGEA